MEQKLLTTKNLKDMYGISRLTLINWEKQGLLQPIRTPGNQRRYRKEDIEKLLHLVETQENKEIVEPDTILYARVSTKKQEEYLKNQVRRLEEYAKEHGYNYEVISEIASGVNEHRKGLQKLLNRVKNGRIRRVIVEYPDRLARFGYEYIKFFMETFGVELIVINGKEDNDDINKELAEDLIALVTSFSARIYGQVCHGSKREGKRR